MVNCCVPSLPTYRFPSFSHSCIPCSLVGPTIPGTWSVQGPSSACCRYVQYHTIGLFGPILPGCGYIGVVKGAAMYTKYIATSSNSATGTILVPGAT